MRISKWNRRRGTYGRNSKCLGYTVQVNLSKRLPEEYISCIGDVEQINIRVRGHGQSVRILRMPLDRMQELKVVVWDDANQDFTPKQK